MQEGFIRVATASPKLLVGDPEYNSTEIINLIQSAKEQSASVIVFPELAITGYTCADLFFQDSLIDAAKNALIKIKNATHDIDILAIVGVPLSMNHTLFNCSAVICKGNILGIVLKGFLPTYNEFYERRWFAPASHCIDEDIILDGCVVPVGIDLIFGHQHIPALKVAVEICEDLWTPTPPSTHLALNGATLIANTSASNDLVGKSSYRKSLIKNQSARTISAYLYASAGYGESTTDVVYGGHCLIYENGGLIKENTRFTLNSSIIFGDIDVERLVADRRKMTTYGDAFSKTKNISFREIFFDINIPSFTLDRFIDPHPFVPSNEAKRSERCEEIFTIQTLGLAKRLEHIGSQKVVIGISGGLDSTLALLVCVKTFDLLGIGRENIIAVTMPGFGTTDRTYNNAVTLIKNLGARFVEISIKDACIQHFKDIGHNIDDHSVTYENAQARERTQILMDLSNKEGGIVIGTGDLSEMALGWATYNGDHMSMYSVNISIPKTLVRYLVSWVSHSVVDEKTSAVLEDVLDTPVSPELLPPDSSGDIAQKTEEVVGPYELHDFYLYHFMRYGVSPSKLLLLAEHAFKDTYDRQTILHWMRVFYKRFFQQQFKRSCLPDGPKVGSICLSPRGDWRMPSDASVNNWLKELDALND